jgi:hypothetical protein
MAAAGGCDRRFGGLPGGPPGPWRGVGRMRLKRPRVCGAPARATVPASCESRPLLQLKHKPIWGDRAAADWLPCLASTLKTLP